LTIDLQNFNSDYDFNNTNINSKSKFLIEERRRIVSRLWAQSKSETEIARELHCNVSTICRDIKFLKKLSKQFVFDLAKDLGFYYKSCIDTMDQIQQKCWNIFNDDQISQKDRLLALKIIKETCESKFSLIEKGPSVMALNSLQERVEKIETSSSNNEFR
jgi:transposase